MKKKILIMVLALTLIFVISIGTEAIYRPHEITESMIEEWAEEVEQYREDSTLQMPDTNHSVHEIMGEGALMRALSFHTVARQIMDEAHQAHRQYREPDIDGLQNIVDKEANLRISQFLRVENRSDRDPDDMHLVFRIENGDEEKMIQPESVVSKDSGYQDGTHTGIKIYHFDYDDFPTRQEYENEEYEITAIYISRSGEIEIEVPYLEIR